MKKQQAEWVARLQNNADEFVQIETEVHQAFGEGGGRWSVGIFSDCRLDVFRA